MSQVNSQPRKSLGGKSPIQVFKSLYGRAEEKFLEAFGIKELKADELQLLLKPLMMREITRAYQKSKLTKDKNNYIENKYTFVYAVRLTMKV